MGEFLRLLVNGFWIMLQMCMGAVLVTAFGLSVIGQLGIVPLVIVWFIILMLVVEIFLD